MNQVDSNENAQFDPMAVRAGDIIFVLPHVSGRSKLIQWGNVRGQRLLASLRTTGKISRKAIVPDFSHVMLGAGDGLVIHADGKKVTLQVASKELNIKNSTYEIYRNHSISEDTARKIAEAGVHYLEQQYDFTKYFLKGSALDFTQFCSRLVAQAYRFIGIPLSDLPDHKVLPVDIHRQCQLPDWKNVTAESLLPPLPENHDLEGMHALVMNDGTSLSEFLDRTDSLIMSGLQQQVKIEEALHKSTLDIMKGQELAAQYCAAKFTLFQSLREQPEKINEQNVQDIGEVLSQLETLLDIAALPDLELLIKDSASNSNGGADQRAPYAGLPTNVEIREQNKARETIRYLSYFLMAEIGLLSILAQFDQSDKLAKFKKINPDYIKEFCNALPDTLNTHPNELDNTFPWVTNLEFQAVYRAVYSNVISAIRCLYPSEPHAG
ncbi:YiiX/YebB-like N1pC/P60 family cysteine hydrolase [Pseudomonas sp. RHF3.3-3]|uniref:YiiX/YebB-like N1pC/P60 family cysteine hydrolase n=1 Tax=Pseudomonas sp. RHF3.3-3 TaxID=3396624 RepID=UPI003A87287F